MANKFYVLGVLEVPGKRPKVEIFSSEHILPKGHVLNILLQADSDELLGILRQAFGDKAILENWRRGHRVNYLVEYLSED